MSNYTTNHLGRSTLSGLTATGSSQTTGFPLVKNADHQFTTVGSSTGAILPASIGGTITIQNSGLNSLSVYPPVGGKVNDSTQNSAFSLPTETAAIFFASDVGTWYAVSSGSGAGSGTVTLVGLTVPANMAVTGSPVTVSGTLGITSTTPAMSVFATSGSYTVPTGATFVRVQGVAPGAGGGGGASQTGGTASGGGGGGGAGAYYDAVFKASDLSSPVTVTVGAAGTGGAGAATGSGTASNGVNGGTLSFGTYLIATAANKGLAGNTAGGLAGSSVTGTSGNGGGGGAGGTTTTAAAGGVGFAGGGGGGGGIDTGSSTHAAGNGGAATSAVAAAGGSQPGGNGNNGCPATNTASGGSGAAGGASSAGSVGGLGGTGGNYGGGGGGGGATLTASGASGGAGGPGGPGIMVVMAW